MFYFLLDGYLVGFAIWYFFVMFRVQISIAKADFRIDYYNSDGFGGLKSFGDLSLNFALLFNLGAFFIPLLVENFLNEEIPFIYPVISIILVVGFPIAIIAAFILPMFVLKSAAQKQKINLINEVINDYRIALIESFFEPHDIAKSNNVIILRYKISDIKEMKVWSINFNRIVKLVSSALIPIALALLRLSFPNL
jgi:hypothetical protein